jgi:hypothetical protein
MYMPLDELIDEYIRLKYLLHEEMAALDDRAESWSNLLVEISQKIRRRPGWQVAVRPLLAHEHPAVRAGAAYMVLPTDPKAALPVLKEVSDGRYRFASTMAFAVLLRWQMGEIEEGGTD